MDMNGNNECLNIHSCGRGTSYLLLHILETVVADLLAVQSDFRRQFTSLQRVHIATGFIFLPM